MSHTRISAPYAKFVAPLKYYCPRYTAPNFYSYDPLMLLKPKVDDKLKGGRFYDKKDDLTKKEMIEHSEAMRPTIEKDFYQDHTYYNQWLKRDLDANQKRQISEVYQYMRPNYQITPWIWYPGDIVEIMSGEFAGQRGSIIAVVAYKNEIIVQNVNVKTITIPASEDRPEQDMQREHPISVTLVKHVDPGLQTPTELRIVSVKDKESGQVERRRISLASGAVLPIPKADQSIEGDPLKDTPYQDAAEPTYDEDKEMATLVERKLQAMEKGFVGRLKESYEFHKSMSEKNEADMRKYQRDVVDRAEEIAIEALLNADGAVSFVNDHDDAPSSSATA